MATNDIDRKEKAEEKPADITCSRVTESITPPLAQPNVVPLNVSVSPVDVEEIRRRTREKLQALNPRGGARERKVYIGKQAFGM